MSAVATPSPTPQEAPSLAAPGAGIPKVELFVATLIFRWGCWTTSQQAAIHNFSRRKSEILELSRQCDAESGARQVLIPRLAGLEDSSRFWSVFMTIEHLRIVNDGIGEIISALIKGAIPPGVVSTADVKPAIGINHSIIPVFEESCCRYEQLVGAAANLETKLRYAHPWFGPLHAAQWHYLAGFHMNLHRKQIEHVLRRMSVSA